MLEKTEVHLGQEARDEMIKGVNILANAVGSTLGPMGNNVVVQRELGLFVTKDGVTVAKNVNLEDSLQNLGCQLVKQAAQKTNSVAGDGTTTSTILAQKLIELGNESLKNDPTMSAVDFKRGMEKAFEEVKGFIEDKALPVNKDYELLKHVATIATNNDPELGQLISDAYKQVGEHGVVTVENSKSIDTTIRYTEGMSFEKGFMSPYFVTNPEKMICEYDDALILIYDGKIANVRHLIPVLEIAKKANKPLLIIAEELDAQTISTLVVNRMRAGFQVVAVTAPGWADLRRDYLQDIACVTGGTVISDIIGKPLESVDETDLGRAKSIKVDKSNTSIIDGLGDPEDLESRMLGLAQKLEVEEGEWQAEKLKERIAKLANGVAVIQVGAVTDSELQERKYRVDDALNAVQAALKAGIIPGGGSTYKDISEEISASMAQFISTSFNTGRDTVLKALKFPYEKLCTNAGYKEIDYSKNLNIKTGEEVTDLIAEGIIDPALVAIEALRNAISVAGMILTTNCALTLNSPQVDDMGHGYDPSMIGM